MKNNKYSKTYCVLGQILCGIAGGIVGFMTGGVGFALIGIIPGVLVGYFLEKAFLRFV